MSRVTGVQVRSWQGAAKPSEDEIVRAFRAEGLSPHSWSNGANFRYGGHSHPYHKVLYCVRGSIVFHAEGRAIELKPGDRMEIPPGTTHSADVGPHGVACMEAARD